MLGERVLEELKSGAQIGQVPELCRMITRGLKEAVYIPVAPKPYSNQPRFLETAKAIEEGGGDAISISSSISDQLQRKVAFHNAPSTFKMTGFYTLTKTIAVPDVMGADLFIAIFISGK